jgi:hypothetical protein
MKCLVVRMILWNSPRGTWASPGGWRRGRTAGAAPRRRPAAPEPSASWPAEAPIRIIQAQDKKNNGATQGRARPLAKQPGPTGEGLAAASLTAAERWWSWSSSSLRLFASTCLRRCSSYDTASAISFRCAVPIPISLGAERNRGADEARRRSRERKGWGRREERNGRVCEPGP